MKALDRAARLLRIRGAEQKAAAAERAAIEAMRRHRANLVDRLTVLHACYQPEVMATSAGSLRSGAFQRDRIDCTRGEAAARLAMVERACADAGLNCREADRRKRTAEKYAEKAEREADDTRERRIEAPRIRKRLP